MMNECRAVFVRLRLLACRLAFLFFAIHSAYLSSHAAFEFQPVGAHTAGAGDVGVALATGAAGAFWNPAAVAWGKRLSAFAAYDRPYGMAELTTQALSAGIRIGRHGLGMRYMGFGFSLYKERVFGAVCGLRVSGQASVGLGVRVLQISAAGMPTTQWTVFDLGLRWRLREGVFLGAVARNAGGKDASVLGQGGAVGVGVDVMPQVVVVADVQKEANFPVGAGIGMLYRVHPQLVIRTGMGTRPERLSAGFGVRQNGLAVDYAAMWHTVLGITHRASVIVAY